MQILVNHTPNLRGLPEHGIVLQPGANQVSDEVAEKVRVNEHTAQLLALGRLELRKVPAPKRKKFSPKDVVDDLSDYEAPAALAAVAQCSSLPELKRWTVQDARPEVRAAIMARAEVLISEEEKQDKARPGSGEGAQDGAE